MTKKQAMFGIVAAIGLALSSIATGRLCSSFALPGPGDAGNAVEVLRSSPDPQQRVRAAGSLKRRVDTREARLALARAMVSDADNVVRLIAASALSPYVAEPEVRAAFESVVAHKGENERDDTVVAAASEAIEARTEPPAPDPCPRSCERKKAGPKARTDAADPYGNGVAHDGRRAPEDAMVIDSLVLL